MILKNLIFFIFVSTLSFVSGRFLQGTFNTSIPSLAATPYRTDMKCGECILGNYTFCIKGKEGLLVDTAIPQTYCCNNTKNCSYTTDAAWNCTTKYKDYFDKFKVCPFIKS